MITLVVLLCAMNGTPLCVDEVIPTDGLMVGKVDSPIEEEFTWGMCKINGQQIVVKWLIDHPQYKGWYIKAWECVPGRYESGRRA